MLNPNKAKDRNQKNRVPKNPLKVDLGFFGKLDTKKDANAFFREAEKNQDDQSVDELREIYNEILVNKNFVRIEAKVKKFLDKITNADSSGYLKHLMSLLVSDGLIISEGNGNGRCIYRKHPQIERTYDLVKAYNNRKRELSKAYNKIMSKPNGVRVEGAKKRHHRDEVAKTLPLFGPVPRVSRNTYIIGYTVPRWLTGPINKALTQIKTAEKKAGESKPVELKVVEAEEAVG